MFMSEKKDIDLNSLAHDLRKKGFACVIKGYSDGSSGVVVSLLNGLLFKKISREIKRRGMSDEEASKLEIEVVLPEGVSELLNVNCEFLDKTHPQKIIFVLPTTIKNITNIQIYDDETGLPTPFEFVCSSEHVYNVLCKAAAQSIFTCISSNGEFVRTYRLAKSDNLQDENDMVHPDKNKSDLIWKLYRNFIKSIKFRNGWLGPKKKGNKTKTSNNDE